MDLPTELAADYTNPADEIPDTAFVVESDPAFNADPLTDAIGETPAPATTASKPWIGAVIIAIGFIVVGVGYAMSDRVLGIISPIFYIGFVIIVVGILLIFIL